MNIIYKKSILCLVIILVTIYSSQVKAKQAGQKNELTVQYGMVNGVVKDQVYSPLNYRSSGGSIGLNYRRNTKRGNLVSFVLNLKTNEIKTEVTDSFTADQIQFDVEASFMRKLYTWDRNWAIYLGGDLHVKSSFIDYEDPITLSSSTVYLSHKGLGFQVLSKRKFGRNTISGFFKMPLVGTVYRSPYNVYSEELDDIEGFSVFFKHGKFSSIHNYLAPTARLTATNHTFKWLDISAGYEINYLWSNVIEPISEIQGHFVITTGFKF